MTGDFVDAFVFDVGLVAFIQQVEVDLFLALFAGVKTDGNVHQSKGDAASPNWSTHIQTLAPGEGGSRVWLYLRQRIFVGAQFDSQAEGPGAQQPADVP